MTPADVGRLLRADALNLGLGSLALAIGVGARAFYWLSPLRKERALLWYGIFSFLYGLRLLLRTASIPLALGVSEAACASFASALTYVIPVPVMLFVRALYPRWRRPLGWVAAGLVAFAVAGVAADVVAGRPERALVPNSVIAIGLMTAALVLVFRAKADRERLLLRVGLVSLAATVVVDNLRSLGALTLTRGNIEPIGATVFIACLGAFAARRALANAQRLQALDDELALARRIQSSILPTAMPRVDGLTVAARYEPMTAVAGDFYEFLESERGLGVLVADVSGHGVPAALIASMVKVAIAAQRSRADHPAAVLAGLQETLAGRLGGQYVTAAYLFLDRPRGLARYAAAGHPPLVRWRAGDGRPQSIEENGFPVGLLDEAAYREREEPLRPGDRFLLYTDGLVEAADAAGELLGLERVTATVAQARDAASAADRLVEQARAWANGSAGDDVTVVVVDCA